MVITTCDSREALLKIAHELIEKELAACVQVLGPMNSIYRWAGKVETAKEWLSLIKTTKVLYQKVEREISLLHPYEVPEIIALPILKGSESYLSWLKENVVSNG